jgi:hypothetical protein
VKKGGTIVSRDKQYIVLFHMDAASATVYCYHRSLCLGFGFLRRTTSCFHAVVALHHIRRTLHPVQVRFLG